MPNLSDKSKLHFQPLLFDHFKYKAPNTTYQSHYNQRSKKQFSAINQQYNNASQKQKSLALSQGKKPKNFVQNNINLYKKKYDTSVFKKDDEHYFKEYLMQQLVAPTPVQYQPQKGTQIMVVNDDNYIKKYQQVNFNPTVTVNEIPNRPESSQIDLNIAYNVQLNSKDNTQKLSSPPPVVVQTLTVANNEEDKIVNLTHDNLHLENQILANQILTSEMIIDNQKNNNKQSQHHWSIYPQEKMPDYIVEAKKRLGQIKQPNISPNSKPPKSPNALTPPKSPNADPIRAEELKKTIINSKHWSQFENPSTPDYIKAIRKRLGDDRYRKFDLTTKSNSLTNLSTNDSLKPSTPTTTEQYKIPTILSIKNNIRISSASSDAALNTQEGEVVQLNPVGNDFMNEVDEGVSMASKYEEMYPPVEGNSVERISNSRTSNDFRMSNKPDIQPNLISFDTWMNSHASDKDKESVIRALKYTDKVSPVPQSPSPSPSKPIYLLSGSQHEFMTHRPQNQFSEFVRVAAKKPSTPISFRKGTPPVRKLGMTRGNSYNSNFSMEDEKKFIRDYLWNQNGPAIIKTGYGM